MGYRALCRSPDVDMIPGKITQCNGFIGNGKRMLIFTFLTLRLSATSQGAFQYLGNETGKEGKTASQKRDARTV